ncbi:MAG: phasin family protein [Rhodoplanes sp.]|uniref:phasin family protein n=1 Tax=Rhodoplanes sp. TaxID=1968906 RepID=UPI001859BF26|nr:phasin family protein [Rhodoplanes sp.]NVO13788.1 phasin family protein [Rhodoplanes sp.]
MSATTPFEIPVDMRKMTEQSLEQARTAINNYLQVLHGGSPGMTAIGETELTDKMLRYAERNVASAFDFAKNLLGAKDVQDVVKIQTEFFQLQMQATAEQVGSLSESAMKAVASASKSRFLPPPIPFGFIGRATNGSAKPVTDG